MTSALAAEPIGHSPAPAPSLRESEPLPARDGYIAALLFLAAVVPFISTLLYGYVYDDTSIARHNPVINGWHTLLTLWKYPYWADGVSDRAGLYRPVQMAVLALIWNAGRGWALWFHLYAVLLHGAATLAVWWVLKRGVGRWPAAAGALWFAVHPVHVEAVANISNTSEILVAVWTVALARVLTRATSAADKNPTDHSLGWGTAGAAAALFAAAMLTKESGVMAPALALVVLFAWRQPSDTHPEGGLRARSFLARWWRVLTAWLAVLVAVACVRIIVLGGIVSSQSIAAPGINHISAAERIWKMLTLGPRVVALLFWPGVHNPHYGPSTFPTGGAAVVAGVSTIIVLLACVVGAVWLAMRRGTNGRQIGDGRVFAALGWIFLAFLPASNLLTATGQILAERTLYGASIGAAMLVAYLIDRFFLRASAILERHPPPRGLLAIRIAAVAVLAVFLGACWRSAIHSRIASTAWQNHPALVRQIIYADPQGYRGYHMLALEEKRLKQKDSALAHFDKAYKLFPLDPQVVFDYASYLFEQNRPAEAAGVAVSLLRDAELRAIREPVALYLNSMGSAWGPDSVLAAATRLNALTPSPTAALYIGLARFSRGDRHGALRAYREGLLLAPNDSSLTANATALERALLKPAGGKR